MKDIKYTDMGYELESDDKQKTQQHSHGEKMGSDDRWKYEEEKEVDDSVDCEGECEGVMVDRRRGVAAGNTVLGVLVQWLLWAVEELHL